MEAVGMPTIVSPPTKKTFIMDSTKLYMKNFTGLPYYVEGDPQDTGAIASTNSTSDVLLKSHSIPSSIYPASYGPYRLAITIHWGNYFLNGTIKVYANGILVGQQDYNALSWASRPVTFTYDNFPFTPGQTLNVQIYGYTADPSTPLYIYFVAIALGFVIQNSVRYSGQEIWTQVATVSMSKSDYPIVINEFGDKLSYQLGIKFWIVGEGITGTDHYGYTYYPNISVKTSIGQEISTYVNGQPNGAFVGLYGGYMPFTEGSFGVFIKNEVPDQYQTQSTLYIYAVLAVIQPIPFFTIQPWGESYHIRIAEGQRGIILYDIRGVLVNMFPGASPYYPSPLVAYYTKNTYLSSIVPGQNLLTLDTNAINSPGLYRRSVALLPNTELLFSLDDLSYADSGIYYIRIDLLEVS
jgi:hypothetical protein